MKHSAIARRALVLAAVNGFLAVMLGAFGAHLLEQRIATEMLDVFATGVRYHMFHVAGLVAVAVAARVVDGGRYLPASAWLFQAGILVFSGSLYVLALSGISWLGMITPVGGIAFLAGWGCLFTALVKGAGSE